MKIREFRYIHGIIPLECEEIFIENIQTQLNQLLKKIYINLFLILFLMNMELLFTKLLQQPFLNLLAKSIRFSVRVWLILQLVTWSCIIRQLEIIVADFNRMNAFAVEINKPAVDFFD